MKKFLMVVMLVSVTAFITASFAAEKDHVPKVEKVSKQEVELLAVANVPSAENESILVHADSFVLTEVGSTSPPFSEAKSGKITNHERSRNSHLIPRIRDKDRYR